MKVGRFKAKNKNLWIGVMISGLAILAGIGYYAYTGYYASISTPPQPQVIKIGHLGPLTGFAANYGEQERQAIDLAVEEINAKGGINGKRLEVIHEDDQLDPTLATNAINKLITVDKVVAVIGELSSTVTLAVAPIAEKNKVVLMVHAANSNKLSGAGEYIFRIYPTNTDEGQALVELASSLGSKNASILYVNNDYGTDLESVVKKDFAENGGTISISEGYNPDETDFRTQLTKVKEKNPTVVFLLGYPKDMAMILRQAKEIGLRPLFLADDTFNNPQIVDWSGNASEGVVFVTPSNGDAERWQELSQKIENKYGDNATFITAMAYDATNLLAASMESSGATSDEIKTGLTQLKDYPGVTGNITFDKNHDVETRLFSIMIVKGGKFEDYK